MLDAPRQLKDLALNKCFIERQMLRVAFPTGFEPAINNFTQWLAIHMAQNYSPRIRVNAIAPGFFITEQNRFLLTEMDSSKLTERGKSVIAHTPMNRFGTPEDLLGATMWPVSPASSFVTGAVIPIDGGFSAFSGVECASLPNDCICCSTTYKRPNHRNPV